ncbi:MAG: 3-phosphoshikimate 1-carboxyvinyltransferase [Desulfovibrio sp.]
MTDSARAVAAPPSKSLSHRKIITSALAKGVSTLSNVLESEDTERTMSILSLAGAKIVRKGKGAFEITGLGAHAATTADNGGKTPLSCCLGESGTSARLLTAVLATLSGTFYLHGAPRLHERPMRDLFATLTKLGASFEYMEKNEHLPVTLRTTGLAQGCDGAFLPLSCDVSSQFLSGLLLAAPRTATGLRLLLAGNKAVSWPYVSLTLQALADARCMFTVEILGEDDIWRTVDWHALQTAIPYRTRFTVPRGAYEPLLGASGTVEGDYSGASYLLAAGAVGPNPVTVTGLSPNSLQGDAAILDILRAMGANVSWSAVSGHDAAVTVSPGKLTGVTLDMSACPDLVPTVAVLAALAQGETRITGVAHLAQKESDRLAAPAQELAKIGCRVTVAADGLTISPATGQKPGGGIEFSAHNDHRMAMSLALLKLAGIDVRLDNPACVAKSFPDFWNVWEKLEIS